MTRLQKLQDQEYTPFIRVLFGQATPTPLPADLNDPANPLHKLECNDPTLNDAGWLMLRIHVLLTSTS